MSPELIGILGVGVALGGLVLTLHVRTDKRLDAFGIELRRLSERVARLEGLIEGAGLFRQAGSPVPSDAAVPRHCFADVPFGREPAGLRELSGPSLSKQPSRRGVSSPPSHNVEFGP